MRYQGNSCARGHGGLQQAACRAYRRGYSSWTGGGPPNKRRRLDNTHTAYYTYYHDTRARSHTLPHQRRLRPLRRLPLPRSLHRRLAGSTPMLEETRIWTTAKQSATSRKRQPASVRTSKPPSRPSPDFANYRRQQMRRSPTNRRSSARSFNRNQRKTHVNNLRIMRGGWRL